MIKQRCLVSVRYFVFALCISQRIDAFVFSNTGNAGHFSACFPTFALRNERTCTMNTSLYMSRDNSDMEEMLRAAQDPKLFEEYVLKKNQTKNEVNIEKTTSGEDEEGGKKKGYVPIEQWEEERSKDSLSWEEKVQFDGQRYGNQFQQNEILRKNLKSW
mmetsp:Transcript_17642/g.22265  ORF Transcript_17642/g.22265 Transcript_17642/m.22265 type:complete len:159 (-) Transcript_17642:816-1292(-)